jgi:hypothetical protein
MLKQSLDQGKAREQLEEYRYMPTNYEFETPVVSQIGFDHCKVRLALHPDGNVSVRVHTGSGMVIIAHVDNEILDACAAIASNPSGFGTPVVPLLPRKY